MHTSFKNWEKFDYFPSCPGVAWGAGSTRKHWKFQSKIIKIFSTALKSKTYLTVKCFFGAQTKRPETKRPWTKRPWGQNVRGDKRSVATKRPSDKTSVGTKGPSDKTSDGQNVRGDKTSVGTKRPWTKRPSGSSLPGPCEAKFFTHKNTHTLSLWFLFLRFFMFIKTVYIHPYYDIIKMHYTRWTKQDLEKKCSI
jgi:hypothetical protein